MECLGAPWSASERDPPRPDVSCPVTRRGSRACLTKDLGTVLPLGMMNNIIERFDAALDVVGLDPLDGDNPGVFVVPMAHRGQAARSDGAGLQ